MITIKKISFFLLFVGIVNIQYAQMNHIEFHSLDNFCDDCIVLQDLTYIELEEEKIEFDFDTWYYLPYDFDAYEGMVHNIDDIEYIEAEELCDVVLTRITEEKLSK